MDNDTKTYQDLESFHNGDVTIYVRSAGKKPVYQSRIRTPLGSGYIVKSLKTEDRDEAYRRAIDLYEDLRFRARAGEEVKSKSASKVIDEYLHSQSHKSRFSNTQKQIGDHFRSFLGKKTIGAIDTKLIEDYFTHRRSQKYRGRQLSENTLNAEGGEISRFLKWAKDRKFIREIPSFTKPSIKDNPRPVFDEADYKKLTSHARHWVKEHKHPSVRRDRTLLWNYILILSNTGIRVGEARDLEWRDVRPFKTNDSDETNFSFRVKGKTGLREVVARTSEVQTYLQRILEIRTNELGAKPPQDSLIFCHPNGKAIGSFKKSFASLLKYCDVEFDREGNKRTIYSLRHTYATFRLYQGVDHYVLAQNMGTSVEMIEKFYGHTSSLRQAGELTKSSNRSKVENIFDFLAT